MNCPKCHSYVSGDFCKTCDRVLFEKKKPITKIKKVSDKKKAQDLVYSAKRLKFLKENPVCSLYKDKPATTIHHKKGRLGSNYLDESTWVGLSFEAHVYVEMNPEWAKENGFSESRLSK